MTKDGRAMHSLRVGCRCRESAANARGLRRDIREAVLDQALRMQIVVEAEAEPATERLKNDVRHAVSWHDGEHGLFERKRDIPRERRTSKRRAPNTRDRRDLDVARFLIGRG